MTYILTANALHLGIACTQGAVRREALFYRLDCLLFYLRPTEADCYVFNRCIEFHTLYSSYALFSHDGY